MIIRENWICDIDGCNEDAFKQNHKWCPKHTLEIEKTKNKMKEIEQTQSEIQINTEELIRLYARIELIKTRKQLLEQRLIMLKDFNS
jgi:hypothetical protein